MTGEDDIRPDAATRPAAPPPTPTPKPPKRRGARRWLWSGVKWSGAVLLGLVLVVLGLGAYLGRTEGGRSWLRATLVEAVGDPKGLGLELGAIEGSLPEDLVIRDLTLSDPDGPWLTLAEARLSWSPLALVTGELLVESLSARGVTVLRAPVLPAAPEEDDTPTTPPDPALLGLLTLKSLDIREITLGPALVGGEGAVLHVTGALEPRGETAAKAALSVVRADAPGQLDLEATVGGAPLALDLSLTAGEPEGGLLAGLLDLEGRPEAGLSVTGSGPLSDWRGALEGGFTGVASLSGPLRLALDEGGGTALGLDWTLTPGEAAPATLRAVAGPETTLGLDLAVNGAGDTRIDRFTLAGPDWRGRVRGTIAKAGTLDLDAQVNLDGVGPLASLAPEVGLGGLSLTAVGKGTVEAPEASVSLEGTDLAYADQARLAGLSLSASALPEGGGFRLALEAKPRGLDLPPGGPALAALLGGAPVLTAAATLDGAGSVLTLESLRLDGRAARLEAEGGLDVARTALTALEARLSLPDLTELGLALNQPMAGALSLAVEAGETTLNPLSGRVSLRAEGQGVTIDGGPIDGVLGPQPKLTASARLEPDGGLGEAELELTAAGASAEGRGNLSPKGELDAHLRAALADLGALAPELSGAPVLEVFASGPVADPNLVASLRADALGGLGPEVADLSLRLTAGTLTSGPAGLVEGDARVGGLPLTLSAPFALDAAFAELDLWDGRVSLGSTGVDLEARVDLASTLTEGRVSLSAPKLAELAALGAPPLRGSLSGGLDLTRGEAGQGARLDLKAPGLAMEGLSLGNVSLSGGLRDALGTPVLDVALLSRGGDAGAVQWSRLELGAKGGLADLALSLGLDGQWEPGPLTARATARLNLEGGPDLRLTQLTAETGGKGLALVKPATLTLARGAMVDELALDLDGGLITLNGGLSDGALKTKARVAGLPLSLVTLVQPDSDLAGSLDADMALSGAMSQPSGTFTLDLRDVESGQDIGEGRLAANVTGTLSPRALEAQMRLSGFGAEAALVTASLPMAPGPTIRETAPLSVRADWRGAVADLWEFSPLVEHRLSGNGLLDLRLTGTMADPVVEGGLSIADGGYENLVTGTVLDDLTVTLRGDAGRRVRVDVAATDGGSGRVTVAGDISLAELTQPEGRVDLTIDGATLVRRDDALASLSADLGLDLTGAGARLAGSVTTELVDIRIVGGQGGGSLTDLEVIEVGGPGQPATVAEALAEREERLAQAGPPLPIALDLTLSMPNRVYVKGSGVESEWKGDLRVTGFANQPKVVGKVEAIYGSASFLGRTFTLRKGEAEFDGGRRIDPFLSVTAENDTGDVTALVTISGPASDPDIAFSSEPALPEDEVISQILFGKTSGELTAFEAVQLAQVAGELAGFGGGRGITDALKDFTGLDVLKLGEGGSGGTTVEAGAYLRENVYVGVEQGLGLEDSAVEVQVELTPQITVETKAGATGTGEAGIFWKKDY